MEKKLTIRLPEELHAALVELADKDRRSLHAEILTVLEEGVKRRKSEKTDN